MDSILRKESLCAELRLLEAREAEQTRRLAVMKATRAVPWREIELAEDELEAIRRRLDEKRKGAAA